MPKITETDIIKRTALLKFLQILDGFHTPAEKKKFIFFSYRQWPIRPLFTWLLSDLNLEMLKKFNLSKTFLKLPKSTKSGFATDSSLGLFSTSRHKISKNTWKYPKPSKLKINSKSFLSYRPLPKKNFYDSLIGQKKFKKHNNRVITNSIQKNIWFPYGILKAWTRLPNLNSFEFNQKDYSNRNHIFFHGFLRNSSLKTSIVQFNSKKSKTFSGQCLEILGNCYYRLTLKNKIVAGRFYKITKLKKPKTQKSDIESQLLVSQFKNLQISTEFLNHIGLKNTSRPNNIWEPLVNLYLGPFNFWYGGLNQNHQMLVAQPASLYQRKFYDNKVSLSKKLPRSQPKMRHELPTASRSIKDGSATASRPVSKKRYLSSRPSFSAFSPILQIKGVPKYEIDLKNQPSNKSLNLLCVWPSYIEDIIGPGLNDSGSYILPEYFQLLGHGPKLKKQGITLIASTNNLTTLDAALLRPGRFDTIINFSPNGVYSFSSIDQPFKMLKHSASLTQDNWFSYYKLYTKEKKQVREWSVSLFNKPLRFYEKFLYKTVACNKKKNLQAVACKFFNNAILLSSISRFNLNQANYSLINRNPLEVNYNLLKNNSKMLVYQPVYKQAFSAQNHLFIINDFGHRGLSYKPRGASVLKKSTDDILSTRVYNTSKHDPVLNLYVQTKNAYSQIPFLTHTRLLFENQTKEAHGGNPRFINMGTNSQWPNDFSAKADQAFWAIKNNFNSQLTRFDKPNQFTPIKTFLDVSIFIQYKLWWSHHNGKLLWVGVDQKSLNLQATALKSRDGFSTASQPIKEWPSKTQVSDSAKLRQWLSRTFKFNISNRVLVLPFKIGKLKDLINLFIGILRIIYFKFFYNTLKFFIIFKNKLKNQAIITSQTSINQNYDSVNALSREVLIYKMLALGFSKKLNSLDSFLEISDVSKTETFSLANCKHKTYGPPPTKSFRSNIHTEDDNMFLKSNRSFLFCTGDFDYKTSTEKDDSIILIEEKSYKKKLTGHSLSRFLSPNKHRVADVSMAYNKKKKNSRKRVTINYLFGDSTTHSVGIANLFLDQSSKTWKPFQTTAIKNVKINHVSLIKYNQIYKLKKIKFKQSFLNLHPFTSLILKRSPQVTKVNKLKRYLKVTLVKNILPQLNFPLYSKNKQKSSVTQNFWFLDLDQKFPHDQIYNNLYSMTLLIPTNNSWLGSNTGFTLSETVRKYLQAVIKKTSGQKRATSGPFSRLKKESSQTIAANSFSSTYESYLLKKLSTNSSLNIICLQTYLTSQVTLLNDLTKTKRVSCNSFISSLHSPQIYRWFKKIPRKTIFSHKHNNFQNRCKVKNCNIITNRFEIKNNRFLLKNKKASPLTESVSNSNPFYILSEEVSQYEKIKKTTGSYRLTSQVEQNFVKTGSESFFENYKMCRLDVSFFLLTFYTMFFEKNLAPTPLFRKDNKWGGIKSKKTILNTIKLFMPYKSLIVSHFLLSQSNTYDFSCKNFEILIYNKFKNFLVDF